MLPPCTGSLLYGFKPGVLSILSPDVRAPTNVIVGEPFLISLHDPDLQDTAAPSIRLESTRIESADDETITLTTSKPPGTVLETYQVSARWCIAVCPRESCLYLVISGVWIGEMPARLTYCRNSPELRTLYRADHHDTIASLLPRQRCART